MGKIIETNNNKIYLEEYIPQNLSEKVPAVILSHGFNGSADDFKNECNELAQKGIACICFDFCGGSMQTRSSGKTTEMSLLTEKENLLAVLEYVKTITEVDTNQIFLFGGSQGGLVSALVAEDMADDIAGLMLMYPALCIPEDWQKRFPEYSDIPDTMDIWEVPLGRIYCETIHDWNVWDMIGKFNKPVMIMHGDKDDIVSIEYAKKAANTYPCAYYEEFTDEGHGFTSEGMKRVTKMVEKFVKLHPVFDVHVELIKMETVSAEGKKVHMIPFSGVVKGEFFEGKILSGGVDAQIEDTESTKLSARYMLEGRDKKEQLCRMFIQNEGTLGKCGITVTHADVVTDSEYLKGWNESGLYGKMISAEEPDKVIIRFYA